MPFARWPSTHRHTKPSAQFIYYKPNFLKVASPKRYQVYQIKLRSIESTLKLKMESFLLDARSLRNLSATKIQSNGELASLSHPLGSNIDSAKTTPRRPAGPVQGRRGSAVSFFFLIKGCQYDIPNPCADAHKSISGFQETRRMSIGDKSSVISL